MSNPSLTSGFLGKQKLPPSKDLHMHKGHSAFCSVECRRRQIFMDEEESDEKTCGTKELYCSLAAMKGPQQVSHASSPPSSFSRAIIWTWTIFLPI